MANPAKMAKLNRRRLTRRALAIIALSSTAYLAADTFLSFSPFRERTIEDPAHRGLLAYEDCNVGALHEPTEPIIPVYAASYPGSGSQMTHYLMEGLTGITAGEEWSARGDQYNIIAIKTHYPAREHQVEGANLMDRVILLLRNPLKALPSHANYMYEHINGLPDHTVHAPLDFWYDWRNNNFAKEIGLWRSHLEYWVDNYSALDGKRLVISYERLVDSKMGPIETSRIAAFLGRSEGMMTVSPEIVPCVWDKVVNYRHGSRKMLEEFVGTNEGWRKTNQRHAKKMVRENAEAKAKRKKNRKRRANEVKEGQKETLVASDINEERRLDENYHEHRKIHRPIQEDLVANLANPLVKGGLTLQDLGMEDQAEASVVSQHHRKIHRLFEEDAAENFHNHNPLLKGGLTLQDLGMSSEGSSANNEKLHRKIIENNDGDRELFEDPTHPTQSLRSGIKVEYKFSEEELITMFNMLYELRDKYIQKADEFTLVVILDSYIVTVEDKLREVEEGKVQKKGSEFSSSLV